MTRGGVGETQRLTQRQRHLLLAAAAISSACSLAIELLLGTLASYLVGNQALAYGFAVGGFLAAMGLGAYLSQFIAQSPLRGCQTLQLQTTFIWIELALAPLCLLIPLGLFGIFVVDGPFWLALFLATTLLGSLAGMELPILTRLLEPEDGLKNALAGALALDYIGALVGSLFLPIVLLPLVGMFPAAALIGALPAFVVLLLGRSFSVPRIWGRIGGMVGVTLIVLAPLTTPLGDRLENNLYHAPVITRMQSSYQRIVLTRHRNDVRLFLDGDLQFSTLDEYRYHEALVHPAMSANINLRSEEDLNPIPSDRIAKRRVLLLGAGDGLALREVLKWTDLASVVLVDLDGAVVNLAQRHPFLVQANHRAFADPRVQFIPGDAFVKAPVLSSQFDVIVADFPDPDRDVIAKLYAQGFYLRLLSRLSPQGVFVTQASSPFFAPKAFACVVATLESIGLNVYPYVIDVPSFGPWGFVMAARSPIQLTNLQLPIATRFLNLATLHNLFQLPADVQLGGVEINRLAQPVIVKYQQDARWEAYD
jgi:spermidine synthase